MVSPQPNKTNSTVINTRCSVRPSVRRHLCGLDPLPLYLHGWWRYTEGGTKATTMAFNKARRASRQTIPSSQKYFSRVCLAVIRSLDVPFTPCTKTRFSAGYCALALSCCRLEKIGRQANHRRFSYGAGSISANDALVSSPPLSLGQPPSSISQAS